jgi:hypothetical protein
LRGFLETKAAYKDDANSHYVIARRSREGSLIRNYARPPAGNSTLTSMHSASLSYKRNIIDDALVGIFNLTARKGCHHVYELAVSGIPIITPREKRNAHRVFFCQLLLFIFLSSRLNFASAAWNFAKILHWMDESHSTGVCLFLKPFSYSIIHFLILSCTGSGFAGGFSG